MWIPKWTKVSLIILHYGACFKRPPSHGTDIQYWDSMMTSSNWNIFRVTGPLCGEFTGSGEFPTQRPVTRSFEVFFDLRLNKRLSKQPWGWWFEMPSWSLWRQCNGFCNSAFTIIFIGGNYFSIDNKTRRLIILTNIACYLKFDILIWTKTSWTCSFTLNNRNYTWLNTYQFSYLKFRLLAKWYCKSKIVILAINKPPRRLYSRVNNVETHTQPGTAFVNIVYLISVSTVKSLI